jgi:hypothetical protein
MLARSARLAVLIALTLLGIAAVPASAQDLHPSRRPSPVGIAKTFLGDTYVKVTYGRPYVREREIFGDPADGNTYLVPFGETWRTGANEATEITVTGPILVDGRPLAAGTYSVFTVPRATGWEIRFHPGLGMDGTGRLGPDGSFTQTYDPALDVLVAEVPSGTIEELVEQFTIDFEASAQGADMILRWERTEVRVPIQPAGV